MQDEKQTQNQIIIVSAVVVDDNGKVLLLKRNNELKRAPGKFEFPSGKVKFGEEPLKALETHVLNQTDLNVSAGKLLASHSHVSERTGQHILLFFNLAKLVDEQQINDVKISSQHSEYVWQEYEKIQQLDILKTIKAILPAVKLHLEKDNSINRIVDESATTNKLFLNCDGGSRGNPGPSACGFVLLNEKEEVIEEGGEYLGLTTNNQAEYHGVRLGLESTRKYKPEKLIVRLDSLLVVNQMKGIFKIKSKDLWPIHEMIKKLLEDYKTVEFFHVPREENELADAKVNEILDSRLE